MIDAIRPMLNEQVHHWQRPYRNLFGAEIQLASTPHAARVNLTPGRLVSPASGERMADAAAIVWLVDHPRGITVGDTFTLPDGKALKVARVEHRKGSSGTVHKVYLS